MNAFFVVWNPARNVPTVRHPTRQAAVAEAERLAQQKPGDEFVVLRAESVSYVSLITHPLTFTASTTYRATWTTDGRGT